MCFYKDEYTDITFLKNDLYVIKSSYNVATDTTFISAVIDFPYKAGKVYKKNFLSRISVKFNSEITGSAFHAYSLESSKYRVEGNSIHRNYGVFRIPKGTKIYYDDDEIICFAIQYIGPLTDTNRILITAQENYI